MSFLLVRSRLAVLWFALAPMVLADTGVIIPADRQAPEPAELSVESLKIRIRIDSGHAIVHWDEVFHNKTSRVLEGTYLLSMPGDASISDFAVWDDLTRIPGVILERKRAGELYAHIRNESIDPGLLQSGETSESESPGEVKHSSQFSVKIVPIPAYGYKRIEAEYRQTIPLSLLSSELVIPLKATDGPSQALANLAIDVDLRSPQPIASFDVISKSFPLTIASRTADEIRGTYAGKSATLAEDFVLRYRLANDSKPKVEAYRDSATTDPGFFEASTILPNAKHESQEGGRTVLVLFDSSLSMQWEKLEQSFQALEAILRSLTPADSFNVLLFNSVVSSASPKPQLTSPGAIAQALDFVRASRLRGGTNLRAALTSAFAQISDNTYIVLLSDGGLTEGTIATRPFGEWLDRTWSAIPANRRPHLYSLALGDDANERLLRRVSSHAGVFEKNGSTEPLEFKLNSFTRKMGLTPFDDVELNVSAAVKTQLVYRLDSDNFPGTRAAWVGQYTKPGQAEFRIKAVGRRSDRESAKVTLPANDTQHESLPATWARARVDALLEKIDRDGEDKASIDEIIALSRRYHFVTPYTSFLAAPRALLRPRLIRPGDPLLRVRTDASVVSVVALFPFGTAKPLRYLREEDIWQTRFLAPNDLPDGTQTVRLILRDRDGHVFREQKTLLISSQAPVVQVHLDSTRARAGSQVRLRVQASQTTRTIAVRLYGADPLFLRWKANEKASTGVLTVPAGMPAGKYSLHVTAEDMAHNVSQAEVPLEVLP